MLLFRIEHAETRIGPYISGECRRLSYKNYYTKKRHPEPWADKALNIPYCGNDNMYFGFNSITTMKHWWYIPTDLEIMADRGYTLCVFHDTPELDSTHGKSQSCFNRPTKYVHVDLKLLYSLNGHALRKYCIEQLNSIA